MLQALPQVDMETAADLQRCQQSCDSSFDKATASTSHDSWPSEAETVLTEHKGHDRQRSNSEASTSDPDHHEATRYSASAEDLDERGSGGKSIETGEQYRNGAVPFMMRRAGKSNSREGQLTHASVSGVAELLAVEERVLPSQGASTGRSSRQYPWTGLPREDTREGLPGYEELGLAAPFGSSSSSMDDDSGSRVMRKALKLRQQQRDSLLMDGIRRGADGAAASQPQRQEQQQRQPGMRCSTYALEAVDAEAMCAASDVACHRCVSCRAPGCPQSCSRSAHACKGPQEDHLRCSHMGVGSAFRYDG